MLYCRHASGAAWYTGIITSCTWSFSPDRCLPSLAVQNILNDVSRQVSGKCKPHVQAPVRSVSATGGKFAHVLSVSPYLVHLIVDSMQQQQQLHLEG
jgi:hypothetical protein